MPPLRRAAGGSVDALSSAGGRTGSVLFVLRQASLCLAGFLAAGAVVGSLVPWPEEYGLRSKFEYFASHKDDFDLVYIGSSRVYRAFDPAVFDAALAEAGLPLASFNLGVGGMLSFEQDFVLHRLLELEPARLRWIFLEGGEWDPDFDYSFNVFSWRSVFWHALPQTLDVLMAAWRDPVIAQKRWEILRTHLALFLSKLSNYGMGKEILADWQGSTVDVRGRSLSSEALAVGRGFEPADVQAEEAGAELTPEKIWTDLDFYHERVARITEAGAREGDPEELVRVPMKGLRRQLAAARERGVEVVYVLPPGLEGAPVRWALQRRGDIPGLLDFNRPERYPQLFDVEHRFDPKHLNRRGAEEFSRLLAGEFLEHVRAREARGDVAREEREVER